MEQTASTALLKKRIKELIITCCDVKDCTPDEIDDDSPLFGNTGGGKLSLDSLDAVEIAMALEKEFGVETKNISSARSIFRSVNSLADYVVEAQKSKS